MYKEPIWVLNIQLTRVKRPMDKFFLSLDKRIVIPVVVVASFASGYSYAKPITRVTGIKQFIECRRLTLTCCTTPFQPPSLN